MKKESEQAQVKVLGKSQLQSVKITTGKPEIPTSVISKWQGIANLVAKLLQIPATLLMKIENQSINVFISSETKENPYQPKEQALLGEGLYCETVIGKNSELLVPNALNDPIWENNPDIKVNMISYFGVPVLWPDGEVFGTFCVLDHKENSYSGEYKELVKQFKTSIEDDLRLLMVNYELEKASEIKTQFLSNMSHEIRTPLNGINGITNLLLDTNLDKNQKELLQMIQYSSDLLTSIVNDILDLSKLESGKMRIKKNEIQTKRFFADILKLMNILANQKKLILCYFIAEDIPIQIQIDDRIVKQIIINIINNAIKFTERGEIQIKVEKSELNKLKIIITDTGIGIPEDKKEEIFDRFNQLENPYTKNYQGTGLGLTIVKGLVDLLHGTIHVKSEVGKGSEFTIVLPFEESKNEIPKNTSIPKTSIEGKKFLIAEDNEINQLYLTRILQKNGAIVQSAEDGIIALERIQSEEFDFILMDIQMPNMNGFECTSEIRKHQKYKNTPILALTGFSMPEDIEKMQEVGINDVLIKPIREAFLLEKLSEYIVHFT